MRTSYYDITSIIIILNYNNIRGISALIIIISTVLNYGSTEILARNHRKLVIYKSSGIL